MLSFTFISVLINQVCENYTLISFRQHGGVFHINTNTATATPQRLLEVRPLSLFLNWGHSGEHSFHAQITEKRNWKTC